jgi:hypothetical protein
MRSLPLYNLFALSNFFLCEDEARDGAYGPPEMSGRCTITIEQNPEPPKTMCKRL